MLIQLREMKVQQVALRTVLAEHRAVAGQRPGGRADGRPGCRNGEKAATRGTPRHDRPAGRSTGRRLFGIDTCRIVDRLFPPRTTTRGADGHATSRGP